MFSPIVVAAVIVGFVSVRASGSWPLGLGWAVLALLFVVAIPYAVVLVGVRRGRLGDRFIGDRSERPKPMALAVLCSGVGLGVLVALGAPADLLRLLVAVLAGLLVSFAVTLRWKISVHLAGLAGALAVAVVGYGSPSPAGLVLMVAGVLLLVLVGWARVRLEAHTVAQVAVGAVVGAAVVGATYAVMR